MGLRVRRRCAPAHRHTAPGAAQIRRCAAFCAGFERARARFCVCVVCVNTLNKDDQDGERQRMQDGGRRGGGVREGKRKREGGKEGEVGT